MLLVIDVGNTNTVLGLFKDELLIENWRIRTIRNTTADELNILINALFADKDIDRKDIKQTVISSVVPPAVSILNTYCKKYLAKAPLFVNQDSVKKLMPILYNNPAEVGADRIVNAIAAFHKYNRALIIIDFGTATTFDVISKKGEYLGGAITPGVMISSEALFHNASKLPRVEIFTSPGHVIGKNTSDSIKSGIIFGNAALVDGMVSRIKKEMKASPMVIATGGIAPLIADVSETIEKTEETLTLEGLRIISKAIPGNN
ncbi:MAG: type III pantothenate kinase [Thermodesulfobacteriota bacterium]|nr:type III pantothenate kinase [Thermodesulfobacteriota bacterium]